MAPAQITWRDLAAWSEQMKIVLEPWEAKTLVTLGVVRANIIGEKLGKQTGSKVPPAPEKSRGDGNGKSS